MLLTPMISAKAYWPNSRDFMKVILVYCTLSLFINISGHQGAVG